MFRSGSFFLISIFVSQSVFAQIGTLNNLNGAMEGYMRGLQDRQRQEQIAIDNTDPRLLPLSPSGGISRYTQQLIFSALSSQLEMTTGLSSQNWRNENVGSSGTVTVYSQRTNPNGMPCREFELSLAAASDGVSRSLNGTACRSGSGWQWLSGLR
jgi:surface antigen